jgi:hypothetical protein
METKSNNKPISYVQIMIDIKKVSSLKYCQNPTKFKKNLEAIQKKFDIENGKPMKYPL